MANKNPTPRRVRRERRRLITGAAIVGAVVIAVGVGYFAYRAQADLPGQKFPSQGNLHVQTVNDPHEPYNSTPPTSGPHLPYIAPWGVHTKPIANELQVHNLEDGGVVVQYNCECPELVEKLAAIVRRHDRFVVLAPYPTMKSRIALTAWTRLETLDDFDAARIERFIKAYRGSITTRGSVVVVGVVLSVVGCARPHISPLAPPPYRAEVAAAYDRTWTALVRAIAKQNLPLRAIARDSGVIASDDVVTPIGLYADCGRVGEDRLEGEALVAFTVFAEGDARATRVQVNSSMRTQAHRKGTSGKLKPAPVFACASTGRFEANLIDAVRDLVKE